MSGAWLPAKLLPDTDPDALKAYSSTLEEARADLFGLYYLGDTKLVELGLVPDAEAYKAEYYKYIMNGDDTAGPDRAGQECRRSPYA